MRHDFTAVTPEDLARLFPVQLAPHDPRHATRYREEAAYLQALFGEDLSRISHIGSTSVPGLLAKPTVDILLELRPGADPQRHTEALLDAGYVVNRPERDLICYIKGYTPRGFEDQAYHVHVRYSGDWGELYFRDYLQAHPETCREYETLKRGLRERYPNDRDGYTAAKGEFVERVTGAARLEFPGRYRPRKS